jgi:peroxiredoxin Q/BCP
VVFFLRKGERNVYSVQLSKDDTPGCTKEACNFRDANHLMQKRGIVVLGVSTDDIPSHQKFAEK